MGLLYVNPNVASLSAQQHLHAAREALTGSVGRISTGAERLSAADDAAGLGMGEGIGSRDTASAAVFASRGVERFRSIVAMVEARVGGGSDRGEQVVSGTQSPVENQRQSQEGVAKLAQADNGSQVSLTLLR